ncbi:MAG: response regulator transcription factor [Deltaproteobacteria bacterium]|nr:response regulator transcription factor [Deltaproteobacteria bacterium]
MVADRRSAPERAGGSTPRILLVDDEIALVSSLAKSVRAKGYDAEVVTDGSRAITLLRDRPFDVVVTDLCMPGGDGSELMGSIQEEGIAAEVIVITGYATLDAAVDCLRKGAVDFLVKPFALETFLQSLDKALDRKHARAQGQVWRILEEEYGLSARQREILERIYVTGRTNRELADEFCVSPETVKSHIKTAYEKLGVSNRFELARLISRLGG